LRGEQETMLEGEEYQINQFVNGKAALVGPRRGEPDLIIQNPGGPEAARQTRQSSQAPAALIIVWDEAAARPPLGK